MYSSARSVRICRRRERVATDGVMDEEMNRTSNGGLCKAKKAGLEPAKTPGRGPRMERGREGEGAIASRAAE